MEKARIALDESFDVAAEKERVWDLVDDPEIIAACIPNATLTVTARPGVYEGTIGVKLGPLGAKFRGEATVESWKDRLTGQVTSRGADKLGSRVNASLTYEVCDREGPEPGTRVHLTGTIEVAGPLARFAQLGGSVLAKNVMLEFVANLEQRLSVVKGSQA